MANNFQLPDYKAEKQALINKEYDKEKVYYCKKCLSLAIISTEREAESIDFCNDCGCTDIEEAENINVWEEMYEKRYGHKYVIKPNKTKNNGRY